MQNILDGTLDDAKTRLFTFLTLGYLGLYVYMGTSESGDPSFILDMDPILLLAIQGLTSGIFFLLLPFLLWRYGLKQPAALAFEKIDVLQVVFVAILAISAMVVISAIGAWNLNLDLPDSSFENWAQAKEAELKILTEHIINFTGLGHFILSLFIIAMIPAIGEELIFRGILQNLLAKFSKNPHIGIWVSAILFSAIHLQFYGFFPRMLLGALFGYLYLWSGRLSVAMLAHFFNNALALTLVYFSGEGIIESSPEQLEQAAPWYFVLAFVIIGGFILFKFRNQFANERVAEGI